MTTTVLGPLCLAVTLAAAPHVSAGSADSPTPVHVGAAGDWSYYNGSPDNTHYSQLKDINTGNVSQLKLAWVYDTKDSFTEATEPLGLSMESNPLIVGSRLFVVSPKGRLICLDASNGRELWTFDPAAGTPVRNAQRLRGLSYWADRKLHRILFTFRGSLYSVDADTGRLTRNFGVRGRVQLFPEGVPILANTAPGAIYRDLIILGGAGSTVRAFNVRTGKERWQFHTIPHPGETGYETWPAEAWKTARGANAWAGTTVDETGALVFVPVGEAFSTWYGATRAGANLFSDSLIALDAQTGRLVWYLQTIRHDLWDRDLPAAPTLVSVVRDGRRTDALAQITKTGHLYVLDRHTGKSLFPLVEKSVPASEFPGEISAPTQIEPQLPLPFMRQAMTLDTLTRRTPEAAAAVEATFKTLSSRGPWDPPSEKGTVEFPGAMGGAQWGGAAYDPTTGLLYVNANEVPWIAKLVRHPVSHASKCATDLYHENCSACHGEDKAGKADIPSLVGVGTRVSAYEIAMQISTGGGRMPAITALDSDQTSTLVSFLQTGVDPISCSASPPAPAADRSPPNEYTVSEEAFAFLDPDGYPAISPPWGTLNAIDVSTGRYAWKIPFGEYPALAAQGLKDTGSENYGGPIVTAGGLVFIGATSFDKKFHAYDARTGKLLWETTLPAPANATPATYRAKGRQFVVIAAGGGRPATAESGSKLMAFALPE